MPDTAPKLNDDARASLSTASKEDRRRAIGAAIRAQREAANRKSRDFAAQIGLSVPALLAIENGERDASLPQLEAIAYLLDMPLQQLLQPTATALERGAPHAEQLDTIIRLRGHIIGARLKQARMAHSETPQQVMAATGIAAREIEQFEIGAKQPGLADVETLIAHYTLSIEDLLDFGIGPLGETQLRQRQQAAFDALPEPLRALFNGPHAGKHLDMALRLSTLSPDQMRELSQAFALLADDAKSP
jgi:transcriptional regulator with XRE-family HTH domain